jgi:hypothetical protein
MQIETLLTIIGWVLTGVGALVTVCGGVIAYAYRRDRRETDSRLSDITKEIQRNADNNRDDHVRIHERLDEVMNAVSRRRKR